MGQLMHDALGIGLAATQLGVMHRVLVYRVEPDAPVAALVNPVLEWSGNGDGGARGGLPLAARRARRRRPADPRAACAAFDEHGEELLIEASGLEARVIQHEMDHLDGVLILERTSRDERKQAMRILREEAEAAPLGVGLVSAVLMRIVYLGTSDFAAAVLDRLAGGPHQPVLVSRARTAGPAAGAR